MNECFVLQVAIAMHQKCRGRVRKHLSFLLSAVYYLSGAVRNIPDYTHSPCRPALDVMIYGTESSCTGSSFTSLLLLRRHVKQNSTTARKKCFMLRLSSFHSAIAGLKHSFSGCAITLKVTETPQNKILISGEDRK